TPQWENRCSKCWQLLQNTQKRNDDYLKNKMAFRQFEERRKLSTESRSLTIKNLLKKSPSLVTSAGPDGSGSSSQHPQQQQQQQQHVSAQSAFHASASAGQLAGGSPVNRPRTRQRSPESQMARDDLTSFLSKCLPPTIAATVSKSLSQLTVSIYEPRMGPEDLSVAVQAYYSQLDAYLNSQSVFIQNKILVRAGDVMEAVERYVCTACYQRLFWADSEEEVADLSLQERIRSLQWVTFGFLETRLDLTKEQARNRLDEAINEMIDINSHRRVEEKLQCLLRCSHKIFDSLRESGAPTSADEFLPALIYVLLKGNPPLIQSNVRFISRFALPSRTMSGEPAYFFTNVSGALQFVQDINHESLKMSRDEFESYTSGELAPPLNKGNCGCNQALSSMESSLARMTKLIDEQKALATRIDEFERQVSQEENSLCDRIRDLITLCPSPEWVGLRDKVARAEAAAADACSLNSTGSSARASSDSCESSESKQPVDLLQ
ncbi:rabx-5, partial [Pristionchus pacificus]